jgi:hypothetical protein
MGVPPEPERGSRDLIAVKETQICAEVMKNASSVTKEYAWRRLLKIEGKSTVVYCYIRRAD